MYDVHVVVVAISAIDVGVTNGGSSIVAASFLMMILLVEVLLVTVLTIKR